MSGYHDFDGNPARIVGVVAPQSHCIGEIIGDKLWLVGISNAWPLFLLWIITPSRLTKQATEHQHSQADSDVSISWLKLRASLTLECRLMCSSTL
jgi:hypothetical protein